MQTHRRKRLQGQSMIRYLPYFIHPSLKKINQIAKALLPFYPSILFINHMDFLINAFGLTNKFI
jgi:hypothetical protein